MTKNKLKILFIPRWYPNRAGALSGIFVKRHAQAVALKHEVAILFVNADPAMHDKMYDSEFLIEDGLPTVRVYYNNAAPAFIKFFRYLKSCRIGIKLIKEKFGVPDISHIHVLSRTFFPACYFKLFNKTPYIITEQWSGYLPEDGLYKGFLKRTLTKLAVSNASFVTTVSVALKNAMVSHGLKNKYSVIPNVVAVDKFFPLGQKISNTKYFFLSVSNMDDRAKNISGTIRSIKKLSELRNDFEHHFVGGGDGMEAMQSLAEKNNILNKFVFFEGIKTPDDVAAIMRKADLFILFSNYDNMPCVMTEALASGLPVIGSAIHGMKEHIKSGLGILVQPGNENDLVNAIQTAVKNLNSFNKNELRQYAVDNFSYMAVSEKFDKIYQQVI